MDNLKSTSAISEFASDKSNKRKRIWDISPDLFCSICGTCLDLNESRMILKKLHIDHKIFSDHEIHSLMVQSLYSENKLSRRLESHLNNKYRYEITQFDDYSEDQFMAVWQDHMKSGNICGLFWVAVAHKDFSETTLNCVFGDIHMLSHLNGGKARKEKTEYEHLLRCNAELTAKLRQEKKNRKELTKALTVSEKIRLDLETKVHNLEKSALFDPQDLVKADLALNSLSSENQELKAALKQSENILNESLELARNFKKEKEALVSDLVVQKEITAQLYQEIESLLRNPYCNETDCSPAECCRNLCEKRVLIVGGITKLKSFYRNVVENWGGNFEYHDGYLQSGEKDLEGLIKKSDLILCPIDCNSHGACLCVKKICTRIDKPYHMLSSSSLSSISSALATASKLDPV